MRPNFICIGTFRSGTTWLYSVLKKHPNIYLSDEKELFFFDRHYEKGIGWYEYFFEDHKGEKCIGEISPSYLSDSHIVPERIKKHIPDVKLIVILRNPVDQIFSRYNLGLIRRNVKKDLYTILQGESRLINNALYFKHLSRYFELFGHQNILVLLYDDLKNNPEAFLEKIFSFLEVNPWYPENFYDRQNMGRKPRIPQLDKAIAFSGEVLRWVGLFRLKIFLNRLGVHNVLRKFNTASHEEKVIPVEAREFINASVAEDKKNLSDLIKKDLSFWR